jgi:hypothetical protein
MKYFIFFFCCGLIACHNESDVSKIQTLEKRNKTLYDSLKMQSKIIKLVYDSLLDVRVNPLRCQFYFNERKALVQPYSRYIKIGTKYTSKIFFVEMLDETFHSEAVLPSKERKLNDTVSSILPIVPWYKNNNDRVEYSHLSFMPKDTGWYYWHGNISVKNFRTGAIRKYPFTDSFYVYK